MGDTNTPAVVSDNAGENNSAGTEETRTFTQDDVNRLITERLAREAKKYGDYDDLKAKAARLEEMEAATATDLEKAVAAARKEVADELTQKHIAERVTDKIEVAAAGKFKDVEDARLRLANRASEFIAEDGTVDMDAITKAVDEVLEKHPHLKADGFTPAAPPSAAGIGSGRGASPKSPADLFAALAEQALTNRS